MDERHRAIAQPLFGRCGNVGIEKRKGQMPICLFFLLAATFPAEPSGVAFWRRIVYTYPAK